MKKLLTVGLLVVLILTSVFLTGCGAEDTSSKAQTTDSSEVFTLYKKAMAADASAAEKLLRTPWQNWLNPSAIIDAAEVFLKAENRVIAFRLALAAADAGDPDGQNWVGMNYAAGEIIRKDVEKAVSYFNLAAAQGHPIAMYYLGLLHLSELNDSNAAIEWLEKAVAAGYEEAKEPLKSAKKQLAQEKKNSTSKPSTGSGTYNGINYPYTPSYGNVVGGGINYSLTPSSGNGLVSGINYSLTPSSGNGLVSGINYSVTPSSGNGLVSGINYSLTPSSGNGLVDGIDYSISPYTISSPDDSRCSLCHGTEICPVCRGRRRDYVGKGSYVNCVSCNGSGRCSFCQ